MDPKDIEYGREYLLEILHANADVLIEFTKVDGSTRKMHCTLMADKLPERVIVEGAEEKPKRKVNPEIIRVWDLEKEAWRSFKVHSVTAFQFSI